MHILWSDGESLKSYKGKNNIPQKRDVLAKEGNSF